MSRKSGPESPAVTPLAAVLSLVYGIAAAFVFCFSGAFGRLGEQLWYDAALIAVTVTASLALAYASMLLIAYSRRPPTEEADPDLFEWHLLVPCRDEESVVAETVSSARTSFPHAHVWVIDDASEDSTAAIVQDLMDFDDHVHLISRVRPQARTGKGDALNAAYRTVSEYVGAGPAARERAVIGVLDADGFLSDNALALLAGPQGFGDDTVGAAQLEVWMKNRGDRRPRPGAGRLRNALGRYLIRMQDIEFRTSNSAMQLLRVQTGTVGMGGNGQFTRLSVLDRLAEEIEKPWGTKLSEDYELGLNILTFGYRNQYLRDAHVSQEALPYFRRLLTQRTRWAQGIMECGANLPALRHSSTLSPTGMAEIHYFMSQPWLMMLNLLLIPVLLLTAAADGSIGFLADASALLTLAAAMVFLVMPYALWGPLYRRWGRERIGLLMSVLLGLGYLVYVYFTYIYYPRAIARLLTGKNTWAKTRRNADDLILTAPVSTASLQAVPLLDAEVLEELAIELEGVDDYAMEVVSAFAIIWPRRMANLRLAVGAEEPDAMRDAIGSIQVSSAMLGASRLEQAAAELGKLAAQGDGEACRSALPLVSRVGEDTIVEIRSRFLDLPTRGQH